MTNKKMIDRSKLIEMLADLSGASERQLSVQPIGNEGDFTCELAGPITDGQRKHVELICEQLRAYYALQR